MCKHGDTVMVRLCEPKEISKRTEVPVDRCLAPLVQELNNLGIKTIGCCCGHDKNATEIIIDMSSNLYQVCVSNDKTPTLSIVFNKKTKDDR